MFQCHVDSMWVLIFFILLLLWVLKIFSLLLLWVLKFLVCFYFLEKRAFYKFAIGFFNFVRMPLEYQFW